MTEPLLSINGKPGTAAFLHVPQRGLWTCDMDLAEDLTFSGRVTLRVGALELRGTVDPEHTGAYRSGGRVRVIAGAAGWERPAPRRNFHADQGLRRATILQDTARVQDETVVIGEGVDGVIGVDFLREGYDTKKGPDDGNTYPPASAIFNRVGAPVWWVDYAGVTQVAKSRPAVAAGNVQVLDYDVRLGVAELADIAPVEVGSTLVLDGAEHTVRELRVHVTPKRARTYAVVVPVAMNRLWDALAAVVRQVNAEKLPHMYRYRVFKMSVNRTELQVVDKTIGLPDALPVSMWPGLAGVWAKLRPGAMVIVQFIEGSVTRPIVTHYEPRGGAGFLPLETLIDASDVVHVGPSADEVRLGGNGGAAVHRVGDHGQAGSLTGSGSLTYSGPNGGSGTITAAVTVTAFGTPATVIFAGSANLTTEALEGSEKVKAAG